MEEGIEQVPRRSKLWLNTEAEMSIRNAVHKVEEMGCNPLLTEAIIKLKEAKDLVSDFIDDRI